MLSCRSISSSEVIAVDAAVVTAALAEERPSILFVVPLISSFSIQSAAASAILRMTKETMSNLELLTREMDTLDSAPARKPDREMLVVLPAVLVSAENSVA